MSITQVLRIVWARRLIVASITGACLLGALLIVLLVPPRWDATSRVILNMMKPDALTGQAIDANGARAYVATQVELIKDDRVAGQVADRLGWSSDPGLLERYRKTGQGGPDFRQWIAKQVRARTKVELASGSNVLEITYGGTDPKQAKAVADALTSAYMNVALTLRRQEAARNADWFEAQAAKARAALDQADAARTAYEKANGIVLADDDTDLESARLRALAASSAVAPVAAAPASSPSAALVAQVDAQIAQASRTLGPNHPELQELRARRAALASQAARERSAGGGGGIGPGVIAAQRARVLAQSDKVERLRQLVAEVTLRREQYTKTAEKAAQFRQETLIADPGVTVLGAAVTPQAPAFPNKPLIFGGLLVLGLGIGVLAAFLMELLGRRVRGLEEMEQLMDVPLLAVIPAAAKQTFRSPAEANPPGFRSKTSRKPKAPSQAAAA